MFIVQLESQHQLEQLTLHKLVYFLRPTTSIFEVLADNIKTIQTKRLQGAEILSHFHAQIIGLAGNPTAQTVLRQLNENVARPYMAQLHLWITKGIIIDRHAEFLVEDNEIINRQDIDNLDHYSAEYWEKRYIVREANVPIFLNDCADQILRTGKYLNVIRQCGDDKAIQFPNATEPLSVLGDAHKAHIASSYRFASQQLLHVLVNDNDLMGHLLSMKRYLLLHQGDFINQFMDATEMELAKNVDKVLPMRLENLLGLTLRLSSTKFDKYNDDLHCQLFPFKLQQQMDKIHLVEPTVSSGAADGINGMNVHICFIYLFIWYLCVSQKCFFLDYWQNGNKLNLTGLECFAFRYDVKWPVSLVLNHFAILEYQMLFRQLFYCKHVERQLCK